ncbi:hypothetical protein LZ32DRAFT_134773 [Colletotrichum eremochloae]|nr:hypothetical protein LZ32DRAFT_134773 [Colletotrichum eremochloae]
MNDRNPRCVEYQLSRIPELTKLPIQAIQITYSGNSRPTILGIPPSPFPSLMWPFDQVTPSLVALPTREGEYRRARTQLEAPAHCSRCNQKFRRILTSCGMACEVALLMASCSSMLKGDLVMLAEKSTGLDSMSGSAGRALPGVTRTPKLYAKWVGAHRSLTIIVHAPGLAWELRPSRLSSNLVTWLTSSKQGLMASRYCGYGHLSARQVRFHSPLWARRTGNHKREGAY